MSENEKNDPSYKQTSSIPLKKETVRVTLKASDAPPAKPHGATKDAPTQRPTPTTRSTPTAPKPTARPTPPVPTAASPASEAPKEQEAEAPAATQPAAPAPPTPSAPKPPTAPVAGGAKQAPAPTIPLKTAGSKPAGAPTVKLSTGTGAPGAGAPTIALKTATKAPLPGGGGQGKSPTSLPKATVALNPPTQPLTANADPAAPGQPTTANNSYASEEDESGATTFTNILAGVGLAAAIIVLSLQLSMASTWISAEDNENQGEWSQLLD